MLVIAVFVGAGSISCSDSDPVSPEQRLAGRYDAVTWTITGASETIDMLAEGSHLWIELRADGTTDGEFFTPEGAAPEPAERRVSLAGTWSLMPGNVVNFEMEGDTFVRFVEWQYGAGRLENEFTIGQYTTRTVLRR
ncbi:MAG: hypothetical protein P8049_03410 [Gemmatimonadota bacterium]|jgi:hypothetical protein